MTALALVAPSWFVARRRTTGGRATCASCRPQARAIHAPGAGNYAYLPLDITIERRLVGSVQTNAGLNGVMRWDVHRNRRTAVFDTLDDVRGFLAGLVKMNGVG